LLSFDNFTRASTYFVRLLQSYLSRTLVDQVQLESSAGPAEDSMISENKLPTTSLGVMKVIYMMTMHYIKKTTYKTGSIEGH